MVFQDFRECSKPFYYCTPYLTQQHLDNWETELQAANDQFAGELSESDRVRDTRKIEHLENKLKTGEQKLATLEQELAEMDVGH